MEAHHGTIQHPKETKGPVMKPDYTKNFGTAPAPWNDAHLRLFEHDTSAHHSISLGGEGTTLTFGKAGWHETQYAMKFSARLDKHSNWNTL